jgi:hypothetical protein
MEDWWEWTRDGQSGSGVLGIHGWGQGSYGWVKYTERLEGGIGMPQRRVLGSGYSQKVMGLDFEVVCKEEKRETNVELPASRQKYKYLLHRDLSTAINTNMMHYPQIFFPLSPNRNNLFTKAFPDEAIHAF